MKKRANILLAVCSSLAFIIGVACGGGNGGGIIPIPPIIGAPAKAQIANTIRPGGHVFSSSKPTAVTASLFAFQVGSQSIAQSFEAQCYTIPANVPQFGLQGSQRTFSDIPGDCARGWNSDPDPRDSGHVFESGAITAVLVEVTGTAGAGGVVEVWINGAPSSATCTITGPTDCIAKGLNVSVPAGATVGFVLKNATNLTSVKAHALKE